VALPLAVLGATEFSVEVADVIDDTQEFEVAAFVETDVRDRAGRTREGRPVLGTASFGLGPTRCAYP
jgi:hypothetical protein